MKLKPMKFIAATKSYLWGGTALADNWGKHSEEPTIAECWELSSYPGSESVVDGGDYDGRPLGALVAGNPSLFGRAAEKGDFPILVKLIDAAKDLSVQVHPADEYARAHEGGHGKTEMWYIADAKEDAAIYYGFRRDVSREEVERSIRENTVTELLRRVPVRKGDAYFVPAGTVHALLGGVTVIEIQQNSNITYRVYDYDRRDKDGRPRALHIAQALDVMDYHASKPQARSAAEKVGAGVTQRQLAACPHFCTCEVRIDGGMYEVYPEDTFLTFTVAEGCGMFVGGDEIRRGETWLVPNGCRAQIKGEGLTLVVTVV